MSKFEVNQKVFDYSYGWGKIVKIATTSDNSKEPIIVFINNKDIYSFYDLEGRNVCLIDNIIKYRADKPTLATKEYNLKDFTQEKQIDYSDYLGKYGMFWDEDKKFPLIAILESFINDNSYPFKSCGGMGYYSNFEPLTDEQLKVLGL